MDQRSRALRLRKTSKTESELHQYQMVSRGRSQTRRQLPWIITLLKSFYETRYSPVQRLFSKHWKVNQRVETAVKWSL